MIGRFVNETNNLIDQRDPFVVYSFIVLPYVAILGALILTLQFAG